MLPIGYVKDQEGHIQIDEPSASAVREAFKMYTEGRMIKDIVQMLNSHGILSNYKKQIDGGCVNRMLRNAHYMGKFSVEGIELTVEPIITEDVFRAVQSRIGTHKHGGQMKAIEPYYLSGKVFCNKCGCLMRGSVSKSHTGTNYYYYRCPKCQRQLRKTEFEDKIVTATIEHVLTDDVISDIADKIVAIQEQEDDTVALNALKTRLNALNKRKSNLVDRIADTGSLALCEALQGVENDISEIEIEIAERSVQKVTITRDAAIMWMNSFKAGNKDDATVKQRLCESFVSHVELYDDKACIVYNSQKAGAYDLRIVD